MSDQKYKLFKDNQHIKIFKIPETENYYYFVKSQRELGRNQIIVDSKTFRLIFDYFYERGYSIQDLTLSESDDSVDNRVARLITNNEATTLIDYLHSLKSICDVDIQDCRFVKDEISFLIQNNGVIVTNVEMTDKVLEDFVSLFEN